MYGLLQTICRTIPVETGPYGQRITECFRISILIFQKGHHGIGQTGHIFGSKYNASGPATSGKLELLEQMTEYRCISLPPPEFQNLRRAKETPVPPQMQ